ncbi:hypothetical protein [Brevifollis gellanilyticus]|uniref:Lipoprotein n=1 Tax=Brevifollis gellanilyticus TaxID=748831 RepID=A0A512M702_9BACT|nr:hypothetical protein [Brevifollis gellanilyticus]GEP42507.1 hypothetical protein BGE01nite_17980 [Brevifollis gellanilyticus]
MIASPPRLAACLAASACLAACAPDSTEPITESRELSQYARPPAVDISSATRFYDDAKPETPQPRMDFRSLLAWTVPQGWAESSTPDPMGMRLVDLRFGPNQEGECYISLLPGPSGGLDANVNRWRSQMGLPPYTAEELASLPKKPFFNREATFVAFDGDFKGFGAEAAKTGYRMLGLINSAEQATIFVKLTGPKALVEQNAAAFDQFCQSIRPNLPKE